MGIIKQKEVLKIFRNLGAILTNGHFVDTSAKHSSEYVNKDAIFPHIWAISRLCRSIAESFSSQKIEVVIAPAIGGVILTQWVADHLTRISGHQVLAEYAERSLEGDAFVIKRGYDKLIASKKILVVDDVITTGGSARKVIEAAGALGGNIVGLGALWNRGAVAAEDLADVPLLVSLVNKELDAWDPAECPMCFSGLPINTNVGKGREFFARQ